MTVPTLNRITRQLVTDAGWQPGTSVEDAAAWIMHRFKVTPTEIRQQHRIGRYRVDFAVPDVQVVIEIDGWQHYRPDTAARDAERDRALRAAGWLVFRITAEPFDQPTMEEQLVRVWQVVRALRKA